MLVKYLILILLPSVVYCAIKISIESTKNGTDARIIFSGKERVIVNDNDRKVFKLDDATLKRASEIYMGKRCGDVYVKSPTPWGDKYQEFGWEPVRKTLEPIDAKIIGIKSKPVAFGTSEYINRHDTLNVTYSTSLTHEVEETVSHTWSRGGEFGVGIEIKFEVNFGFGSAGGSTSMSYKESWGEDTTKARAVTLGTTSTILVVVLPKSVVIASLQATEGTLIIEITYRVILDGRVFCNYPNKFNGHYFYGMPVQPLLKTIGVPTVIEVVERISVGYYSTAKLEVTKGDYVE